MKTKHKAIRHARAQGRGDDRFENDFRCVNCSVYVPGSSLVSGVVNRNHCPYCLYSLHVDAHKAGDRLSVCRGKMKPIGLTLKKTHKKYGLAQYGELMLIHLCEKCEKLSINRIAADDDAQRILQTFEASLKLENDLVRRIREQDILLAGADKLHLVRARLFGRREELPSGAEEPEQAFAPEEDQGDPHDAESD